MKYILIVIAFIGISGTAIYQGVRTDATMTGSGITGDPLRVDTSKVATAYDLMSAAGGASYDVYTALLTQTGTSAPTATVLENTIGSITWGYIGAGNYSITFPSAIDFDKTFIYNVFVNDGGPTMGHYNDIGGNAIEMVGIGDDLLNKTPFEIRIYP
jgi:hypothetical protein